MYTHRRQTNTTTKMYKNTIYLSLIYKLIHILIYKANKIIRIKSDHNIITKYLSHCCYCMAMDLTTPTFAFSFFYSHVINPENDDAKKLNWHKLSISDFTL